MNETFNKQLIFDLIAKCDLTKDNKVDAQASHERGMYLKNMREMNKCLFQALKADSRQSVSLRLGEATNARASANYYHERLESRGLTDEVRMSVRALFELLMCSDST